MKYTFTWTVTKVNVAREFDGRQGVIRSLEWHAVINVYDDAGKKVSLRETPQMMGTAWVGPPKEFGFVPINEMSHDDLIEVLDDAMYRETIEVELISRYQKLLDKELAEKTFGGQIKVEVVA